MATPSLLLSRRDLDFLLYEWLDAEELTRRPRFAEHSRETFDAVLDLSAQIATRHFAPHNKKNDQEGPRFDGERVHTVPEVKEALDAFTGADLLAAPMDEELGGMQLPQLLATACFSWFQAANVGTSAYVFLTLGNARLLCEHGTREQIDTYVRPMLAGRFFGTMCLSEPQAGSSLADVATRAEEQPDGTYRLFGSKMWISAGDHELAENIVHLVLARIPGGPPGVKGLSLFIVPKHLGARTVPPANATTSSPRGSTTRWATAVRPTPCSTSERGRTVRAGARARWVTSWANRTAAWRTCST
jgi:butyryl-CoA dehydrogenase